MGYKIGGWLASVVAASAVALPVSAQAETVVKPAGSVSATCEAMTFKFLITAPGAGLTVEGAAVSEVRHLFTSRITYVTTGPGTVEIIVHYPKLPVGKRRVIGKLQWTVPADMSHGSLFAAPIVTC
jgi:hypothetical protein